jgi:hypothetical protein
MFRFLNNLFRDSRTTSSARRGRRTPRRTVLQLEGLEDRMVPTASLVNPLQAVAVNNGSVAFFLNQQGALCEKTTSGATINLLPGGFPQFSAGVDRFGNADVFSQNGTAGTDKTKMLEFNTNGVHLLTAPVQIKEFAATHGDRVYVVGTDGSLWENNPVITQNGGWTFILRAGGNAQYVDAVTQSNGVDALFVVAGQGQLFEVVNGVFMGLPGTDFTPGPNFFEVDSISAGLDVNGNADVFGLANGAGNGELFRWTNNGDWRELGAANQFTSISATNAGQVFCHTFGGALDKFDAQNNLTTLQSSGVSGFIAAASSNDVYFARIDGSLWEETTILGFLNISRRWEGPNSVLL